MKLSLKLYRKLFRLFCLKRCERKELEKKFHVELMARTHAMYDEYVGVYHELTQWQAVARMYRIGTPYDLCKALEGRHLQPEDYTTAAQLKALEAMCAAEYSKRRNHDDSRNKDS